jgi:Tfp pilus assembly protein PilE
MVLSVFILFFITIVAYQGITSRANTNSARANATSVQSYAETFNADNGRYPDSMKDLNDGTASSRLPSGITIVNTDSVLENSKENIRYQYTGSLGAATGGRITYWDFDEKMADDVIYVGDANTDSAEFKDVQ